MKPQHIYQEVLVSRTTTLAKKVLHEIDDNKSSSSVEKFEEACWNGLLNEMFSELIPTSSTNRPKIFIWGMSIGKSYLLLDLADVPCTIESVSSIDPHLFLSELNLS